MNLFSLYSFFIFLFGFATGDKISSEKVHPRIYGGYLASDGQFPFMGYISYGRKRFCGASIIHQRWALTAAHCIIPSDNPVFTVGKVDDEQNGTSYKIEAFFIHGDYIVIPEELNNDLEFVTNDIALLKLDSYIEFNDTVSAVQLPTDKIKNYENKMAITIGWGRSSYFGLANTKLRYAEVRVLSMEECQKVWTYAGSHLCTSNKSFNINQGVCNGDSGSPLVIGKLQIGVTSTTDKYCESKKPDLYTKVVDFVPWIKRILKKYGDSLPNT